MEQKRKNIVVIGGGPGGYPAAIKAAQLGADVTLIDRNGLGGTCLHRGCIPTKYLLKAAKEYETVVKYLKKSGGSDAPTPDLTEIMKEKLSIVDRLAGGTALLLKNNGVRVISGTATFVDPKQVRIEETGEVITGSAFIIATGSDSVTPPVDGIDSKGVFDSSKILELEKLPASLAVVGGGYIGLEFAQIYQMFGTQVTVIEMMPHILPEADMEVSSAVQKILSSHGVKIHTGARLKSINQAKKNLRLVYEKDQKTEEINAENVLVAVGRKPRIEGLGLESVGVRINDRGAIDVNAYLETSVPGIYAVGDVAGGMMLAHKATAEGETAAVNIISRPCEMSYSVVPSVMYTHPEMASVGLSEAEAKDKYGDILVGRFPLAANGRAVLSGARQGFVKVIAELETEIVVGAGFICPEAGHLVGEAALAIHMEATLDDIAETIHAHPTLSEAFREAALDAKGEAIHLPPG